MDKTISKVEVKGLEALFYDTLMDIITFGKYRSLIYKALSYIELKDNMKIIDFGCGTGRNILILNKYAKQKGLNLEFYGIDKGKIMLKKARKKSNKYPNIIIKEGDIREGLNINKKFDAGLISFVLHGFIQKDREEILNNFSRYIKKGGKLYILDYNEINLDKSSLFVKFFYKKVECPLAEDFIKRDLIKMLESYNFKFDRKILFFKDIIRLAIFSRV